jgi:ABC-type sulfate transport system substrate-binding protein
MLSYIRNISRIFTEYAYMSKKSKAESNRERFVRLVNARVNRAIKDIRLVGNLSNRAHYDFNEQDVKKILKTFEEEVRNLRGRFDTSPDARGSDFSIE